MGECTLECMGAGFSMVIRRSEIAMGRVDLCESSRGRKQLRIPRLRSE